MKKQVTGTAVFLAVWELVSLLTNNKMLFAGPIETVSALFTMMRDRSFYSSILSSFIKVAAGFSIAAISGSILAILSYSSRIANSILSPFVNAAKTIPVISFIIIALLYMKATILPAFIAFMIVLPVIYHEILKGLENTDLMLLEMCRVFQVKLAKKIRCIYIPCLEPFVCSAIQNTVGLAWKSAVSAEVLALSAPSIGEMLYESKIYFEPARLFAWTLVIVLLCHTCEKALGLVLKWLFRSKSFAGVGKTH